MLLEKRQRNTFLRVLSDIGRHLPRKVSQSWFTFKSHKEWVKLLACKPADLISWWPVWWEGRANPPKLFFDLSGAGVTYTDRDKWKLCNKWANLIVVPPTVGSPDKETPHSLSIGQFSQLNLCQIDRTLTNTICEWNKMCLKKSFLKVRETQVCLRILCNVYTQTYPVGLKM